MTPSPRAEAPPPPSSTPKKSTTTSTLITPALPTPHWGHQSFPAFTVRATNTIAAPPQLVLSTLLDTSTWPKWNRFVPAATITSSDSSNSNVLRPGTAFMEHVDMTGRGRPSRTMDLVMTTCEEMDGGWRVMWVGKGYPDWALRSERVHEVSEAEEGGGTRYDVYETFSGPLAWVVRVFVGQKLVQRFGQWNEELGAFVEGLAGGEGARVE